MRYLRWMIVVVFGLTAGCFYDLPMTRIDLSTATQSQKDRIFPMVKMADEAAKEFLASPEGRYADEPNDDPSQLLNLYERGSVVESKDFNDVPTLTVFYDRKHPRGTGDNFAVEIDESTMKIIRLHPGR